jgi:ABC-type transport system involved in multi-copper enzyme maturation permease subunit
MIEMSRRFLRQKLGSPATIFALCALALVAALPLNAGQGFGSTDTVAVLVLAAGCVSRDASSGALQMILSRPLSRTDYLAGRYLGILSGLAVFLSGTIGVAALLRAVLQRMAAGPAPEALSLRSAGLAAGHAFLAGALLAAALLCLSTFLRGWGDVLAVALFYLLFTSLQGLGSALHLPAIAKAGELARLNLAPSVPWENVFAGQDVFSEAIGRYVLALVAYATLAVVIFSRREFSYGQD